MKPFPKNIFVLCTGRCGSTTFARACGHLTNRTIGHESRSHVAGPGRTAYPENHIEVDNRLTWFLGRMERDWGDRAAYLHLTRDAEEVAQSFESRAQQGILKAYRNDVLLRLRVKRPDTPLIDICRDYVDTALTNIEFYLRDKSHVLTVRLEEFEDDFETFLGWSGATGDLVAARKELKIRYNVSGPGK
jgi:hypothetical protein